MIDPTVVFEDLKAKANAQQVKSLTVLNAVLAEHHEAGEKNFSIAEIARLSVAKGGPSTSTIRNKTGMCFRQLIEVWAAKSGMSMKKPINPRLKSNSVPKDYELLQRIDDPALRGVFGMIIAERNRYRNELNTLKGQSEFIIDMRPLKVNSPAKANDESVQVIPSLRGVLNGSEIDALKGAIDDAFIEKQGWLVGKAGQVRGEFGPLYKHGYVNAIKKVLAEIE
ncbi:gamma-mobile-trio protein GmtX [Pseudomonas viridiflava]